MIGKPSTSKQVSSHTPDSLVDVLSNSPLLLSSIPLPTDYYISYVKYEAVDPYEGHQDIEIARRKLIGRNDSQTLLDGVLPYVQLTKNQAALWVFSVEGNDGDERKAQDTESENLRVVESDKLQYREIYPCSLACSLQRAPCHDCLNPPRPPQHPTPPPLYRDRSPTDPNTSSRATSPSLHDSRPQFEAPRPAACLLPRQPLRIPLKFFLAAVRDRFIDSFCQEATDTRSYERRAARAFRGGFLLSSFENQSDWDDEWINPRRCRPLTYCRISTGLYRRDILLSYKFSPTYLSPLSSCIPVPSGSPLYLLPYSTPAYFVNAYTGPSKSLLKQFDLHLAGLGAGHWNVGRQGTTLASTTEFVIVWVKIQPLSCEEPDEKGFFAIWPTNLCVSVLPVQTKDGGKGFAYHREMQSPLPELPPALQPSPVPIPATVLASAQIPQTTFVELDHATKTPDARTIDARGSPARHRGHRTSFSRPRSSLMSHCLHSFRRNALSRHRSLREVRDVAQNVRKFVDSVAKEREKERERMRKERLGGDASQQAAKQAHEPILIREEALEVQEPNQLSNVTGPSQSRFEASYSSSHPSYPSPPDEPLVIRTNPASETRHVSPYDTSAPPRPSAPQSDVPAVNFMSFEGIDESWMSNSDFMMDLGIDFNMGAGIGSSSGSQELSDPMKIDFDSIAFTDDDFSFFDEPTTSVFPTSTNPDVENAFSRFDSTATLLPSPSLPVHRKVPSTPAETPWPARTPGAFASPVSIFSHHNQSDTPVPDFDASSPSKSLASHSGPPTPTVDLSLEGYQADIYGSSQFDPVQFGPKHSLVDAKYTAGKFYSPSPYSSGSSVASDCFSIYDQQGLPSPYTTATDPRVGMVRLLQEHRKIHDDKQKILPASIFTAAGSGDWLDIDSVCDVPDEEMELSDDESDFSGSAIDADDLSHQSRPSTPVPSYLPPGASLLATRFSYDRLIHISQCLPIHVGSFDDEDMDMVMQLVPTPVSPSPLVNTTDDDPEDKMVKHLFLLQLICKELLENPTWADSWMASIIEQSQQDNRRHGDNGAWIDDLRLTSVCFNAVKWSTTPISIGKVAVIAASLEEQHEERNALCVVEPSNIIVGKSDSLVQVSPPALQFWDELGLSPRSGKKDVTAFVIHNEHHDITDDAASWLADLSQVYKGRAYGNHIPGVMEVCKEDGVLVFHFERFKTNMYILQLPDLPGGSLVFYVITTTSMLSPFSTALHHVLNGIKHVISSASDRILYFHLVPDYVCKPSDCHNPKEMEEYLVQSVYDRIRRPSYKMLSRPMMPETDTLSKKFNAPAFVLARRSPGSVSLEFQSPEHVVGVADRHMLLHVGFCESENKRWLIAVCLDGRGDMQDIDVWKLDNEQENASNLWGFALKLAVQANIEWRVVFTKLGPLSERDIDAWNLQATSYFTTEGNDAEMHASLLSLEKDSWILDDIEVERVSRNQMMHMPDSSSRETTFSYQESMFLLTDIQCLSFSSPSLLLFECGHIPKEETDDPLLNYEPPLRSLHSSMIINFGGKAGHSSRFHARHLHLLSSVASARSTLQKTERDNLADISRSFCDLAVLNRLKHGQECLPLLPFHLAKVELVRSILDLISP